MQNPGTILMDDYPLNTYYPNFVFLLYVLSWVFFAGVILIKVTMRSVEERKEKVTYKKD